MAIGRRAQFFTLISVVLVVVMIAFFMPNYDTYSFMSKVPTLKTRFVKANDFVSALYGDVGVRMLTYSSYNALKSLNQYINTTNRSLADVKKNFSQVVLNGSLGGVPLASMKNNSIPERLAQLSRLGRDELGLKSNISIGGIEIYQSNETGFDKIGVVMNLSIYLDAGIATWNVTKPIYATLDIELLYDPYYIMNFEYGNRVSFTNITNWSITGVDDAFYHIDNMKYAFEPDAPSFLMRFENSTLNSSCCGIESLINPVKLNITRDVNVSYVDYCFFNTTKRDSCGHTSDGDSQLFNFTHISNVTPKQKFYAFKLEGIHTVKYNLQDDVS
jgi:hypothetical protein